MALRPGLSTGLPFSGGASAAYWCRPGCRRALTWHQRSVEMFHIRAESGKEMRDRARIAMPHRLLGGAEGGLGLQRRLPEAAATHADDGERRAMVRKVVAGVSFHPEQREIEIRGKPPTHAVQRVEAAARIALTGTVLAEYARVRLLRLRGSGRRAAAVQAVEGP